jgi:hypothetical protein
MKLARIEHWRCGEPMNWRGGGGYTYVWVPDEMSAEELDALCEQAQKAYLDAEHAFKTAEHAPPPSYGPLINNGTPDDKTVGQLRMEHAEQAKAHKEYQELVSKSRKPFAWHLNQASGGTVVQFWENPPDLKVELSWGHNHGVTLEHSPTLMADYPFPESEDDL